VDFHGNLRFLVTRQHNSKLSSLVVKMGGILFHFSMHRSYYWIWLDPNRTGRVRQNNLIATFPNFAFIYEYLYPLSWSGSRILKPVNDNYANFNI